MAQSYDNHGGTGDRTSDITVTASVSPSGGVFSNLVDGATGADATDAVWWQGAMSGEWVKFDFGQSRIVDECRWLQDNSTTHGAVCQWQGSNNDTD